MKNKEERYNQSIRSILFDMVRSVYLRYHYSCTFERHGTKWFNEFTKAANKATELSKRIDIIKEDEIYWILSNLGAYAYYHDQRVDSRLFIKRLYRKLNKVHPDSLNNNRLVRMLKNAKWLQMYIIEQGE